MASNNRIVVAMIARLRGVRPIQIKTISTIRACHTFTP